MTKLISITGRAQSGKTSSANFIAGYLLKNKGIIDAFDITEKGELVVPVLKENDEKGFGILDFSNKDYDFVSFMAENIWPTVKLYSLADNLKMTIMKVFGVPYENLYGTNEQKNAPTKILWSNFFPLLDSKTKAALKRDEIDTTGYMTARNLMQYFGTNVCRKLYDDCWVDGCVKQILEEAPEYAIVSDGRFENEVTFMKNTKELNTFSIKLTLNPLKSEHESEISVDNIPLDQFDSIIINDDIDIYAKNDLLLKILKENGVL